MKATNINTGQTVAIKLIKNVFESRSVIRYIVSEVQVMRQLSQMNNNFFTVKLLDLLLIPFECKENLFIVMEYLQSDLRKVLLSAKVIDFQESHI